MSSVVYVKTSTAEYWDLEGLPLSTNAWAVTTFGGSPRALPVLRGDNQVVPYRPGRVARNKLPDSRTVTFMMWVTGADPETGYNYRLLRDAGGNVVGHEMLDAETQFSDNLNLIRQTLWQPSGATSTLTRRWRFGTGMQTASAEAQLSNEIEPVMTGRTRATLSIDMFLADPYFYGPAVPPVNVSLSSPVDAYNPGDDIAYYKGLTIYLPSAGTLSNNRVPGSPISVTVSTGGVTLNCENFTVSPYSYPLTNISHLGAKSWFALFPGNNPLTWSGSGTAIVTFQPPYV